MTRATRVTALMAWLALSLVAGRAEAQTLTIHVPTVTADRGATACVPGRCSPANISDPGVPFLPPNLQGRHVCLGTSLADTAPAYRCSVFVAASLSGRAVAKNVPVTVTFLVTSDDGAPWNDDVRRTLRAQPALMKPPASGAPAPCSLVPVVDKRVSCVRIGPRTYKVSATTRSKTGLYVQALQVEFPSKAGTEKVCEYLKITAIAKSSGQVARVNLKRRRYCA